MSIEEQEIHKKLLQLFMDVCRFEPLTDEVIKINYEEDEQLNELHKELKR